MLSYALAVEPKPHFINWQQDPQGNHLARVVFPDRVTHFDVTVDLVADMATINPFDFFLEPEAETWPFGYDPLLEQELAPFRRQAPIGSRLQALLDRVPRGEQRTVDMLVALNRLVQSRVAYIVRMEPARLDAGGDAGGRQAPAAIPPGCSCRGAAPSRYAARLRPVTRSSLSATLSRWKGRKVRPPISPTCMPGRRCTCLAPVGWVGRDLGIATGEGHIPLAATPDPQSAAAITGAVETCETEFGFDMRLMRLRETPRVTKPYTEAQWQDILALEPRWIGRSRRATFD